MIVAAAARASGATLAEVRRQLKGFVRGDGSTDVTQSYTPSYRLVVDLGARLASERAALPLMGAVVAPWLNNITSSAM
jgi:Na+/H+-translocating membrane pyrophosphatase